MSGVRNHEEFPLHWFVVLFQSKWFLLQVLYHQSDRIPLDPIKKLSHIQYQCVYWAIEVDTRRIQTHRM